MKLVIENVIAGVAYPDEGALEITKQGTMVFLVAKYSTQYPSTSRDQSTTRLNRKQALQLAGALQLAAWSLDDPLND